MKDTKELPDGGAASDGLSGLQSEKSIQRLEQIASLRARGISKSIDLPQLVVCGDQSAGKSSVLEGISSIPFPRADGVCTKFPTEVILEHSDEQESITASIIPHTSRSEASKKDLQSFHSEIANYAKLPEVISNAGELMGLRGYGQNRIGPAFCEDVLRIKVVGRAGLHLSIVDLPGLISTQSEEQTQADVDTVHRMVDSYIEKPRTIILAIVQASNDIANQSIIRKSKLYDKAGKRTVGIITKPDLINKGTEGRIALLAKNHDTTKLELGFYILRNPTPLEVEEGITAKERTSKELHFFGTSPWREQNLDPNRVGIDKLREFLQVLLDQHVAKELPKVRDEIRSMIVSTEQDILRLPRERSTSAHLRMFLSELASKYQKLSLAALGGDYHNTDVEFFATEGSSIGATRLRALVHCLNAKFAADMRDRGQSIKQTNRSQSDRPSAEHPPASRIRSLGPVGRKNGQLLKGKKKKKGSFFDEPEEQVAVWDPVFDFTPAPEPETDAEDSSAETNGGTGTGPRLVTEAEMKAWVKETYLKTRGRELPGNYNHVLLTELFHQQSQRWPNIAEDHLEQVFDDITTFVKHAVTYLGVEGHVTEEIHEIMITKLQNNKLAAARELKQLCADEQQQPITYNHYYTDNVQRSRLSHTHAMLEKALSGFNLNPEPTFGGGSAVDPAALLATLQKHITMDMDQQACSEALDGLNAYYKVALKTFTDNVCRQVIERHLLRNMAELLSPTEVAGYSDEELTRIAGERPDVVLKRTELQAHLETLQEGLKDLRK